MDHAPTAGERHLEQLCSLHDPTRRRLYDYVIGQGEPVTRDRASAALGVDRSTVAYHLDRLVEEGLLAASFARPEGRGGPGAGRPAKRYQRSSGEFAVSVPPRDYRLAAELLARAAETDSGGTVRQALARAAAELGRELATSGEEPPEDLFSELARLGFEPYDDGEVVRLRNCPFHRLAQEHTELICGMNLAMLTGVVDARQAAFEALLDPADGRCCVALVPRRHARGGHDGRS
jgi:predicted ArsR family transcriptional regulator